MTCRTCKIFVNKRPYYS